MNKKIDRNSTSQPNFVNIFGTSRSIPFENENSVVKNSLGNLMINNTLIIDNDCYEGDAIYIEKTTIYIQ